MSDNSNSQQPSPKSAREAKLYPPSFVDRLMAWIERLPGPAWGFYLLLTVIFVALGHGLRWLDGSMQAGTFDPLRFANDSLTVYALALMHYLNQTARESLAVFRPALGKLEAEYERLEAELTTTSPRSFLISTAIGFVLTILSFVSDPVAWGITAESSLLTDVVSVVQGSIENVFFFVLIVHTVQQVRLIVRIHRAATNVSLYESNSHHAFSRLTVRAAIGLVFPIYYYSFIVYLQIGRLGTMSAVDNSLVIFCLLISAVVFILPLNDMRRRLVREKQRLMVESDRRFEAAARKLHQHVDADNLEKMDDLNKTLASLVIEKDALKKISTWPWEAETMRGFLSSVGLPILLWFITKYLSRFFE